MASHRLRSGFALIQTGPKTSLFVWGPPATSSNSGKYRPFLSQTSESLFLLRALTIRFSLGQTSILEEKTVRFFKVAKQFLYSQNRGLHYIRETFVPQRIRDKNPHPTDSERGPEYRPTGSIPRTVGSPAGYSRIFGWVQPATLACGHAGCLLAGEDSTPDGVEKKPSPPALFLQSLRQLPLGIRNILICDRRFFGNIRLFFYFFSPLTRY